MALRDREAGTKAGRPGKREPRGVALQALGSWQVSKSGHGVFLAVSGGARRMQGIVAARAGPAIDFLHEP